MSDHCDPRVIALYLKHYSSAKGKRDVRLLREHGCVGVGEKLVLLTVTCDAVFAWLRSTVERMDHQPGVNCTIFRNTGPVLSSVLVEEADRLAWGKWPGERHFTFVDAAKTAKRRGKRNPPGRCFIEAGWRECGESKNGLVVLERLPTPDRLLDALGGLGVGRGARPQIGAAGGADVGVAVWVGLR